MARCFYEAIVEAGRRGLVLQAEGPFDGLGALSTLLSGRCLIINGVSRVRYGKNEAAEWPLLRL